MKTDSINLADIKDMTVRQIMEVYPELKNQSDEFVSNLRLKAVRENYIKIQQGKLTAILERLKSLYPKIEGHINNDEVFLWLGGRPVDDEVGNGR